METKDIIILSVMGLLFLMCAIGFLWETTFEKNPCPKCEWKLVTKNITNTGKGALFKAEGDVPLLIWVRTFRCHNRKCGHTVLEEFYSPPPFYCPIPYGWKPGKSL